MTIIKKYDSTVDALYISLIRDNNIFTQSRDKVEYTYCFDARINFYLNFDISYEGHILGIEIIGAHLGGQLDQIIDIQDENDMRLIISNDSAVTIFINNNAEIDNYYIGSHPFYISHFFEKIEVGVGKNKNLCHIIIPI